MEHLYRPPTWHPRPRPRWLPPVSSTTTILAITTDALVDEAGAARASYTVDWIEAVRLSDKVRVATWTNQTTNGSGVLVLSDAALTAVPHLLVTYDDNETPNNAGAKVYTPA